MVYDNTCNPCPLLRRTTSTFYFKTIILIREVVFYATFEGSGVHYVLESVVYCNSILFQDFSLAILALLNLFETGATSRNHLG